MRTSTGNDRTLKKCNKKICTTKAFPKNYDHLKEDGRCKPYEVSFEHQMEFIKCAKKKC